MSAQISTRIEQREGGAVAWVTVDNARKLNVIGTQAMRDLAAAMREVSGEAGLRAVVLRGAGERAFIGGADINEMAGLTPGTARVLITSLHLACAAIRACPVPVIARMQGYTLGGGLEVAAACDMRIAGESAKFGMPETRVGIPSVIEAALLPQLVGWGVTRRILLTGEVFGTVQAERWGLVEEVVADDALDAAIDRVVGDVMACGPRAVRMQKALMQEWETLSPAGAIQAGVECFVESWRDPEPARMMAAFLAHKRKG
jgi:enoyl-CoA hydratase/carnithine racemase